MRYYWLKLKENFFRDLRVKKLRRSENGAALTLLYLELLLAALATDGMIPLLGMDAPAAELSLLLDAPEEDCAALLDFLTAHGLLKDTERGLYLPMLEDCTGSETDAAGRMRKLREERRGQNAAPALPTAPEYGGSPSFFAPEHCANTVQQRDVEKEIEKEIDTEKETEAEKTAPFALPEEADCPDPERDETAPPLPLESGEEFYLTKKQTAEFAALYPTVNLPEQFRAMRGWLLSNPDQRKPPKAMLRFVNGWLNKEQAMIRNGTRRGKAEAQENKNGRSNVSCSRPPSYDIEAAMLESMRTVPKVKKKAR